MVMRVDDDDAADDDDEATSNPNSKASSNSDQRSMETWHPFFVVVVIPLVATVDGLELELDHPRFILELLCLSFLFRFVSDGLLI
jgi:hypothetical protein